MGALPTRGLLYLVGEGEAQFPVALLCRREARDAGIYLLSDILVSLEGLAFPAISPNGKEELIVKTTER